MTYDSISRVVTLPAAVAPACGMHAGTLMERQKEPEVQDLHWR